MDTPYRLTYATMFDPPPALHQRFDAALAEACRALGADHAMHIAGRPRDTAQRFELHSPIDRELLLGRFPLGSAADIDDAVAAARAAWPGWAATPYAQRHAPAACGVGHVLSGAQLRVDARGHVLVRGPMRMAGYLGESPLAGAPGPKPKTASTSGCASASAGVAAST